MHQQAGSQQGQSNQQSGSQQGQPNQQSGLQGQSNQHVNLNKQSPNVTTSPTTVSAVPTSSATTTIIKTPPTTIDCPGDGHCSSRGACDSTNGKCICNAGFSGNSCQSRQCRLTFNND